MRSKWSKWMIAGVCVSLLAACGCGKNAQSEEPQVQEASLQATDEKWVYIEFTPDFPAESIRVSLTPAANKEPEYEVPLTYYTALNGCVVTLEPGEYCVQAQCDTENISFVQDRYFVVDDSHSYYHIYFTN